MFWHAPRLYRNALTPVVAPQSAAVENRSARKTADGSGVRWPAASEARPQAMKLREEEERILGYGCWWRRGFGAEASWLAGWVSGGESWSVGVLDVVTDLGC